MSLVIVFIIPAWNLDRKFAMIGKFGSTSNTYCVFSQSLPSNGEYQTTDFGYHGCNNHFQLFWLDLQKSCILVVIFCKVAIVFAHTLSWTNLCLSIKVRYVAIVGQSSYLLSHLTIKFFFGNVVTCTVLLMKNMFIHYC